MATNTQTAAPAQESTAATTVDDIASGRVKWFNNKAGYGFITVNDCEDNTERDIFVHHSEIKVEQTQYKYLVQGEYVDFVIGAISREGSTDVHATSVRGVNGGKLMCETRNEVRAYRASQPQEQQTSRPPRQEQQTSRPPREQSQQAQPVQGQTQRETKQQRPPRQAQQTQAQQSQRQQSRPQLAPEDQTEWMVVPRRRTETIAAKPKKPQPRQRQPEIEIAA